MIADKILDEDVAFQYLQDALNSTSPVGIDTETSGLEIRDGRHYGFGISIAFHSAQGLCAFYMPFKHTNLGTGSNYNLDRFLPVLQELIDSHLNIFFNAKFDLVSLSTFGLQTDRCKYIDCLILAHLVNENTPVSKSLESCSQHYLRDGKKKDYLKDAIKIFGWGMLTPDLIAEYATYDAVLTLRLYEALKPLAQAEKLTETWRHKAEFLRCLIDMESMGIRVDQQLCKEMAEVGHREMDRIKDELGLNPASRIDLEQLLIQDLKLEPIYSEKTGNITFDKNAMAVYERFLEGSGDQRARRVLEFRGWQKSVSSNYEPYISLLSPDGRLRPNYKMHGTKTGRLSCENPNLQQIPKAGVKPWNGKMKECFVPATDYVLVGFDYSQLELRVGTAYAQEASLAETFRQGKDIFTEMSQQLGMSRNDTKTLVYSIQYGAGINRIRNVFRVSTDRAQEIRQNYYDTYPAFRSISKRASDLAARDKRIKLWSGRYRHFQYAEDEKFKAFNSVIQGGAADIVERAMLRIWRMQLPRDECRMLLQVHDELIFEIRQDLVEKYKPIIMHAMTQVDWHPMFETVKFAADCKLWGEK